MSETPLPRLSTLREDELARILAIAKIGFRSALQEHRNAGHHLAQLTLHDAHLLLPVLPIV